MLRVSSTAFSAMPRGKTQTLRHTLAAVRWKLRNVRECGPYTAPNTFHAITPSGDEVVLAQAHELLGEQRAGDAVVVEGVDDDDVVDVEAPGEELAAVGDVDGDALVVGEFEERACDLDDLAVDLGDVEVHRRVVAPHPLDDRAAAEADDERARGIRLHGERDVQVADVLDGGLERVVDAASRTAGCART